MEIRAYRDIDHDQVVELWRTVFPDAPARNDPLLDVRRKLAVQPELFLVASNVLPPGEGGPASGQLTR